MEAIELQMWATFAIIIGAFVLYSWEILSIEITSLLILAVLTLFFTAFPVFDAAGVNVLSPDALLKGFANPALITILALLVIGEGMVRTGVLDKGAQVILGFGRGSYVFTVAVVLAGTVLISGFLNNIPVVVILIPVMQAVAAKFGKTTSAVMMPLSFAAILGGMTTLIGSGSNLLVNSALIGMGETPFGFFDFTIPGVVLAGVGLVYLLVVAPFVLPERESLDSDLKAPKEGRQYIAQLTIGPQSDLIGSEAVGGIFPALKDMTLRMVARGEEAILPPFEDYQARVGDVLVVAAVRDAVTAALQKHPGLLYADLGDGGVPPAMDKDAEHPWHGEERVMAEAMVAPSSNMVGRTLPQIGFRYQTNCIVLGIQRRSRMVRGQMTDIRLEAGDVLLVQGSPEHIQGLRFNRDVVLIEWSAAELPAMHHSKRAAVTLGAVILAAASGVVPIVVAALAGVVAMLMMGVLNLRQAARAIDSKILTMIPAALGLGAALSATGGAQFIAERLVDTMNGAGPVVMLSGLFAVMVVLTNVISSKAMAVLFTPIAVDIAIALNVPWEPFAIAVILAANCSFASPIGYQTNLLVMGPGHYKFRDFAIVGVPLIFVVWAAFTVFVPWWYGMTG